MDSQAINQVDSYPMIYGLDLCICIVFFIKKIDDYNYHFPTLSMRAYFQTYNDESLKK